MELLPFELAAFIISLLAFIVGSAKQLKPHVPFYFKLQIGAVGCYTLEELWTVVNTAFGTESGFFSVRLFGIFGFFCFLLAANRGPFDRLTDEKSPACRKAGRIALLAPTVLFLVYLLSYISPYGEKRISARILGFIVLTPMFPASWYCLKHRFLPKDRMGYLSAVAGTDIVSLVIFLVNTLYLFRAPVMIPVLYFGDVVLALLVALLTFFGIRGGKKWKTTL